MKMARNSSLLLMMVIVFVLALDSSTSTLAFVTRITTTTTTTTTTTSRTTATTTTTFLQSYQSLQYSYKQTTRTTPTKKKSFHDMTLYEILGASPTESRAQIKKRYLIKARECHPDVAAAAASTAAAIPRHQKHHEKQTRTEEFQVVVGAWNTLSDHKLRQQYDRELQAQQMVTAVVALTNISWQVLKGLLEFVHQFLDIATDGNDDEIAASSRPVPVGSNNN